MVPLPLVLHNTFTYILRNPNLQVPSKHIYIKSKKNIFQATKENHHHDKETSLLGLGSISCKIVNENEVTSSMDQNIAKNVV